MRQGRSRIVRPGSDRTIGAAALSFVVLGAGLLLVRAEGRERSAASPAPAGPHAPQELDRRRSKREVPLTPQGVYRSPTSTPAGPPARHQPERGTLAPTSGTVSDGAPGPREEGSGQTDAAEQGSEPRAATPVAPPGTGKAAPDSTPDSHARRAQAAELLRLGKAAEAADLYAALAAADPSDEESSSGRVRALIRADRWRDALAEARRFAGARPESPALRTALGEALYRAARIEETESELLPLVGGGAVPPRALMTLGLVRVAEGREDEGANLLDRALAADPQDREILREAAGVAPTRAGAVEILERYLERSEGDDPDRIEGARGTIRLYKALGEKPVWVRTAAPERAEIPLRSLRDKPGPATGYVIEMGIPGGKPIRLLLDTGSSGLFLIERIAAPAGLAPLAEETTFGGGGSGKQPTKRGLLPLVGFGELRYKDALVTTTTQEIEPTGRYHGVLGLSVFHGYRVTLDLAREKLVLEAVPRRPTTVVAESTSAAAVSSPAPAPAPAPSIAGSARSASGATAEPSTPAPSTSAPGTAATRAESTPSIAQARESVSRTAGSPGGATRPASGSPYWTVSGQMLVSAGANGAPQGLFLFDTGAAVSLLAVAYAESVPKASLGDPADVRGFGGLLHGARTVRGVRLAFQGFESQSPVLNASDLTQRSRLGGVELSGYLGLDLLDRTRIIIDTSERRVEVEKPGKK